MKIITKIFLSGLIATTALYTGVIAHADNTVIDSSMSVKTVEVTELKPSQKTHQFLIALAGLLGLSTLCALAYAINRNKIAKDQTLKLEEALSAGKIKSEFFGMISHEFRSPLNGIIGIADLLSTQGPTGDVRGKAAVILESGQVLCDVVESIVDMSTIESGDLILYPSVTDIVLMVKDLDQVWRPVIEKKGIIFTSHVDPILSEGVELDEDRYRQCLNNLLSNAAKFTEKGRIHLHVTAEPIENTQQLAITAVIADTGQGISREVQDKLFTPFQQADRAMARKFGGAGLSLTITRNIAQMMGGDVTLDSKKDCGSIFTLTVQAAKSENSLVMDEISALLDNTDGAIPERGDKRPPLESPTAETVRPKIDLPISTPPPAQPLSTPLRTYNNLYGLKVLIVEDVPSNQDVIKLLLEPQGCELLCAANGREALDVLKTHVVDIILMDIRMPEMNGIEATRAIRGLEDPNQHVPIIALTADAAAETNAECMAAGADIFLTKPVTSKDLIDAIQFLRHLAQGEEEAESQLSA